MLISTEQLIVVFQESKPEYIYFAYKSRRRAIEAITPYSGKPMFVVIEIALDTGALGTAETVVDATEITLVRIILSPLTQFILSINLARYIHQSYLRVLAQSIDLLDMEQLCKSYNMA